MVIAVAAASDLVAIAARLFNVCDRGALGRRQPQPL
jgi:hypothetical protein